MGGYVCMRVSMCGWVCVHEGEHVCTSGWTPRDHVWWVNYNTRIMHEFKHVSPQALTVLATAVAPSEFGVMM